jgi:hypothetical protein
MIKAKQQRRQDALVLHAIIHAILAACLAGLVCDWRGVRFIAAAIFASHWLIDAELRPLVPARAVDRSWVVAMMALAADQVTHLMVVVACVYAVPFAGAARIAQWSIPMLDQKTLDHGLVFIFVFSGQYAAVGFLIAGKGVLRFGEIKASSDSDSRKEPEYVLIGTLMSVAWAVSAAMLALQAWSAVG